MEGDGAARAVVGHLHLQSKHVAKLPFQDSDVGIACLLRPIGGCTGFAGPRLRLALLRQSLGLAHRKPAFDDLASEIIGIVARRDRPGMAHADIASH